MKVTKIIYPDPVVEYFAIKATNNLKEMKADYKAITTGNLKDVVKLVGNTTNIMYFYSPNEPGKFYEYLVITKITEYINGRLHTEYTHEIMTAETFDYTFKTGE